MNTLEAQLLKEKERLEEIIQETEKRLNTAPRGHIQIMCKNNRLEYYYKKEQMGKGNGKYMRKSEKDLVKKIIQRDYDKQVIKRARERAEAIHTFLYQYEKTSLKQLYDQTNQYRRQLADVPEVSDEEYRRRWEAVEYEGKSFQSEETEIITEKGERVRSKSEKIIADKLFALGIPYRYEYPLQLDKGIRIYPDFTILKQKERQEVYLEHFGKMDDSVYVEQAMLKLATYERNRIYLGKQLFLTFETSHSPLNIRALDEKLRYFV